MNAAVMLLAALSSVLVLRSGERIEIDGPVREENGQVIFRSAGTLYSLSVSEIAREASQTPPVTITSVAPAPLFRLRVSEAERDRLIRELEQNHSGKPAPVQRILEEPPPPRTRSEVVAEQQEEWAWRRQARHHEETIRQQEEALQLLLDRVAHLQGEIRALLSLGFRPQQFTYQSTILQRTLEQIPYAELSLTRARRIYEQFREDARRQGVLPGWLR
ncbi:MAG TPA: hypothetical protein VMS98_14660 [Thermoanaerobaculia bacterium]|nr:hypothetical protein [Thermoanaerobaculia bacterium]